MSKINLMLDASLLDALQTCEYKYWLRHVKNKEPLEKALPLGRGTIIHAGKEAYFLALQAGKSWETAVDECLLSARKAGALSTVPMVRAPGSKDWITVDFLIETLERECKKNKLIDLTYNILNVETSFTNILYEDDKVRFVLIGKIDLGVDAPPNYKRLPFDHKSHTRDFGVRRYTNQFINYSIAMQSNYLLVNRIGLQEKMDDADRFKRVMLSYDDVYKEQWKTNTIKWFWRYYDCIANDDWPQNLTSCDKFNRECEFFPICDSSGESAKTFKLNTQFRDGEVWDVSRILTNKD